MPKGTHDKNAPASGTCEFCGQTFTTRGMTRHQNKCAKKLAHDQAAAKKPRAYNIGVLNDGVLEHVLKFLGNQTLTKLQALTGDRYAQCEPELARFCCKCENDNPVIVHGLCRGCEAELSEYVARTTKEVAKLHYGVRDKDFPLIPCQVRKHYTLFDRATLEDHMIRTCGGKMGWGRDVAKRDARKKKLRTTLHKKEEEAKEFLEVLAPGFAAYVGTVGLKKTDKEVLQQWSQRYVALTEALRARGLELREDSRLCLDFITAGYGRIEWWTLWRR